MQYFVGRISLVLSEGSKHFHPDIPSATEENLGYCRRKRVGAPSTCILRKCNFFIAKILFALWLPVSGPWFSVWRKLSLFFEEICCYFRESRCYGDAFGAEFCLRDACICRALEVASSPAQPHLMKFAFPWRHNLTPSPADVTSLTSSFQMSSILTSDIFVVAVIE